MLRLGNFQLLGGGILGYETKTLKAKSAEIQSNFLDLCEIALTRPARHRELAEVAAAARKAA